MMTEEEIFKVLAGAGIGWDDPDNTTAPKIPFYGDGDADHELRVARAIEAHFESNLRALAAHNAELRKALEKVRRRAVLDGFESPGELESWMGQIHSTADAALSASPSAIQPQEDHLLDNCPKCGGRADNGFDRCIPPSPYFCTKCSAQPQEGANG